METENLNSDNGENVDIDTTENIEPVDGETTESTEETPEEKIAKLEETNKQLFARAKKAEDKAKNKSESPTDKVEVKTDTSDIANIVGQEVQKVLDSQVLDALEVRDDTKKSLKSFANAEGLTINEAMKSDYFIYLKEKDEKAQKVDEASLGKKQGTPSKRNFDLKNTPKVDMSTDEGQETWKAWKQYLKDNS